MREEVTVRRGLAEAAAGAALVGAGWAMAKFAPRVDRALGDAGRRASHRGVEGLVVWTTDLGSMYTTLGMVAVLAALGRRRAAVDAVLAGTAGWVAGQLAKRFWDRPRPYDADGIRRLIRRPTGTSFPSGHAAVAGALFPAVADHMPPGVPRSAFLALSTWVPFTRVYAGVHYPSDVVAGAGLGMLLASLVRALRPLR